MAMRIFRQGKKEIMSELSKEQKSEIRDICKKVVKEDLGINSSSIRILSSGVEDVEGGVAASVTAYFFTVAASPTRLSTETVRYNMTFKSKAHGTDEEAFEAIKVLAGNYENYTFTKKKTKEDALYRNVYEFTCEEK